MTLGLIPDWQFSANPQRNPMVNPHVSMPEGIYQAGVYSTQPPYGPVTYGPFATYQNIPAKPSTPVAGTEMRCLNCGPGLGYVMIDEGGPLQQLNLGSPFDNFWFQHKKGIVLGAIGVVVAGLLFGASYLK